MLTSMLSGSVLMLTTRATKAGPKGTAVQVTPSHYTGPKNELIFITEDNQLIHENKLIPIKKEEYPEYFL